MSTNPTPASITQLFALAEDAADGAHEHGATLVLKQNTEADIRASIAAAHEAENAYGAARTAKETLSANLHAADANARAFIKAASAYFSQSIAESWSVGWVSTGFPNQSTAIPSTQDARLTLCGSLKDYFTANPTREVNTPHLILTADKAGTLFTALSDARAAVNNGNTDAGGKKKLRDDAVAALRVRIRGLIDELGQLLEDHDPRWDAFGLSKPGAESRPDAPAELEVTPVLAGQLLLAWAPAARADRYHVWMQIVGSPDGETAVATVTDCSATLSGLTSGQTVKIRITAVNDAGESVPSEGVTAVVP